MRSCNGSFTAAMTLPCTSMMNTICRPPLLGLVRNAEWIGGDDRFRNAEAIRVRRREGSVAHH
jgi:hypothetical protein